MKNNRFWIIFSIVAIIGVIIFSMNDRAINAQYANGAASSSGNNDAIVSDKLDQVLANQKLILDELSALKEQVNIVKVRVTQAQ